MRKLIIFGFCGKNGRELLIETFDRDVGATYYRLYLLHEPRVFLGRSGASVPSRLQIRHNFCGRRSIGGGFWGRGVAPSFRVKFGKRVVHITFRRCHGSLQDALGLGWHGGDGLGRLRGSRSGLVPVVEAWRWSVFVGVGWRRAVVGGRSRRGLGVGRCWRGGCIGRCRSVSKGRCRWSISVGGSSRRVVGRNRTSGSVVGGSRKSVVGRGSV